ncbi:MAG: type II toxin-antitoxin system HicB family antitoxin [Candidatus Kerfeldbacteria bacterium]|nr:type II toxin-antitoxin system HicB family antitoxin [Candidatus Kerfeldbacteria bacterium]
MAHKILQYTVLFTPDDESGGFSVEVPALPGCHTQGETVEEAKKNAREAIELTLETLAERKLPFPEDIEPNFFKGKISIDLDRIPA